MALAFNEISLIISLKAHALECIFKGTWSQYILRATSSTVTAMNRYCLDYQILYSLIIYLLMEG